jgi:hypothetical protein
MKEFTQSNCPMLCGYTSESGSKIEYHLINNCPKKLLVDKNFTLCKFNPSILISDELSHFSVCQVCRQYKDKKIMLDNSNEIITKNNVFFSDKNKINYTGYLSINEKCDDSIIPSRIEKTGFTSKSNFENSMFFNSININPKKDSNNLYSFCDLLTYNKDDSRECKDVKSQDLHDTMLGFDQPCRMQQDYNSIHNHKIFNMNLINETMNECTEFSKKIIQTTNTPKINKYETIDDSIFDSSYFLEDSTKKREKDIVKKEFDLDDFKEYFAN